MLWTAFAAILLAAVLTVSLAGDVIAARTCYRARRFDRMFERARMERTRR